MCCWASQREQEAAATARATERLRPLIKGHFSVKTGRASPGPFLQAALRSRQLCNLRARIRQDGGIQHRPRLISEFAGIAGSRTFRALSAPETGSFSESSNPSWTSTEAWSQ